MKRLVLLGVALFSIISAMAQSARVYRSEFITYDKREDAVADKRGETARYLDFKPVSVDEKGNWADASEKAFRVIPGDYVTTDDGLKGEVSSVNVLRQLVKVVVEKGDSKEICEYKASEIRFMRKGNRRHTEEISPEELRALEMLEKQDVLDYVRFKRAQKSRQGKQL